MADLEDLRLDYRVAVMRYLPRREESALAVAYELGRTAVVAGISVLELARIHHEVLAELLEETPQVDVPGVAAGAGSFFLEALATFDMAQRGLLGET